MSSPSRRRHARFPCRIPVRARASNSRRWYEGELINLSLGGALLRLPAALSGPHLLLEIDAAEGKLALEARVVRSAREGKDKAAMLFGVVFEHDGMSERSLRPILDRVRREEWASKTGTEGGELKRDYWSL